MHRSPILTAGAAAALLVLGLVPPANAGEPEKDSAHAVLIGGNLQENAEILRTIVDLADPDGSGPLKARIAIVTAAASPARTAADAADSSRNNAAANGLYYGDLFQRYGAETYAVPIDAAVNYDGDAYTPAKAGDSEVAAQVAASTGVFFGGGDQMRYVRTLFECTDAELEAFTDCADTLVMSAIRNVAARGVVAGVSAGLTIQHGADMVTGGESYQAWRDGGTAGYLDDADALGYLPYGGFGFIDGVLLDSHFTTWGRQGRVVKLGLETGNPFVLGIDETTAVVLDRSSGKGRVIGENGASLIDLRDAVPTPAGVEGVRWSYVTAGDELTLKNGAAVKSGKGSSRLDATGDDPAVREDIWDSLEGFGGAYTLRDLAQEVVGSPSGSGAGVSYETGPRFQTSLERDSHTKAWTTAGGHV